MQFTVSLFFYFFPKKNYVRIYSRYLQGTTNNPDEKKCTMPLTSMRNSEILKKWSEIQTVIISHIYLSKNTWGAKI